MTIQVNFKVTPQLINCIPTVLVFDCRALRNVQLYILIKDLLFSVIKWWNEVSLKSEAESLVNLCLRLKTHLFPLHPNILGLSYIFFYFYLLMHMLHGCIIFNKLDQL